jgi:translation initiation factor 1
MTCIATLIEKFSNHHHLFKLRTGLAEDLDVVRIAKALKKTFQCNGSVTVDQELGEILMLSGDQRTNIRDFFVDQQICHDNQIVIHGG